VEDWKRLNQVSNVRIGSCAFTRKIGPNFFSESGLDVWVLGEKVGDPGESRRGCLMPGKINTLDTNISGATLSYPAAKKVRS
jgi:hypothetical protein